MNGVVYIAKSGHAVKHMQELNYSAASLRAVHPDINITLYTDKASVGSASRELFNDIKVKDKLGDREKQNILADSPYERTLYLDTDTKIVAPVDNLFGLLDRFDIAACADHARKMNTAAAVWPAYDAIPESFSEFAGGVILLRKSQGTKDFFTLWQERYKEWCEVSGKQNDQPSFRVSLWECDLRIFTLPPEYNVRTQEKRDKIKNIFPRILHWHTMYNPQLKRTPQRF